MATHATVWSGLLSSAESSLSVGTLVVLDGDTFKIATTANRTSYGRTVGVAITAADSTARSFEYQVAGVVPAATSGLAAGSTSWVRASATGAFERCTPGAGDDLVGKCNAAGDVTLSLGAWDSANYAGGGGGGGGTVPTGTGFTHITAGAQDAAAAKVNLTASADVTVPSTGIVTSDGSTLSSFAPGTGVQAFLTTPSSANLRTALTDETGTGSAVFATAPTLVTPVIGAATGTSLAASSFLSVGATPATAGQIRLSSDFTTGGLFVRNSGNTANINIASEDGTGGVNLGDGSNASVTNVKASSTINCVIGSTTQLNISSGIVRVQTALHLADSDNTASYIFVPSNLSANRNITLPLMTGNDTMVLNDFAATLTNKTISGASNTLSVRIANDVTGLGTGVATFLATPSSANLATAITDETGSAGNLVFSTNPSLTGPTLTTSVTLSTSGMSTTASGNSKGTSIDKCPVNVQTTDATVTTLDSFTLASNTAVTVTWQVTAVRSTLASAAGYSVMATFRNNAGTVAQVGTTQITALEDDSAWACTIDNSTTTIRLRVTGAAATTIQWTAIMTRLDVIP